MSQRYLGGVITANPTTPTLTTESGVWTLEQQFQYSSVWSPKIIGNSVRLRASANAFLSRTPATASNREIWTWSAWVKRGTLGTTQGLLKSGVSAYVYLYFNSTDTLYFDINTGSVQGIKNTSAVYRDPSAWYHIVAVCDTTQATALNRMRLYVNGSEITAWTTNSVAFPQGYDTEINNTTAHNIGTNVSGTQQFDGYMAEINFIDGQALTPSSFGAFDTNGVWQPLLYTGTYGTNGFYLTFADNSAATATTLGKDYSGNGNNWTPNNISVTSGVTYDSMIDVPTQWADGGNGRGNYCVGNPLTATSGALTNANLTYTGPSGAGGHAFGTFGISSGKYYWEATVTSDSSEIIGIQSNFTNTFADIRGYSNSDGKYYVSGTGSTYGATYTTNDVIGVALDMDAGTLTFYKNNTTQGQATSGLTGTWFPAFRCFGTSSVLALNFGQRPFAYTPPTGFLALNTQNLPVPNITNGAQYFAASTYTGTGATQSINNGGNNPIGTTFQPDFVWIKQRSGTAQNHALVDAVRGVNLQVSSSLPDAEINGSAAVTALNSNGFTLGNNSNGYNVNANTQTYIGWQWRAGVSAVTNTAGTITSTVDAGTTQGFSIVTYTGNGTGGATVGHGLGVAPKMIIIKRRSAPSTSWAIYQESVGATKVLQFDTNSALTDSTSWNNTSPTSSVFTVGTAGAVNANGGTFVAYCFAQVAGFSAFGSYTGNGSTDGPFVYLGFRPRWVMVKRTDTTSDWTIWDTSRDTYNAVNLRLFPNLSSAEAGGVFLDVLSNGFKIRDTGAAVNGSGGTFIYACFAENPFQISRAR